MSAEARKLAKWLCRQGRLPAGETMASVGRALDAALERERAAVGRAEAAEKALDDIATGEWGTHAASHDYDVRKFARDALAAARSDKAITECCGVNVGHHAYNCPNRV